MQRYRRNIEDLPAEMVERVISYVPPKNLCSVMLVSSKMRILASNPKLWTQMKVKDAKTLQSGSTWIDELFLINRFSKIQKLDLDFRKFPQMTNEELARNMSAIKSSSVEELKLDFLPLDDAHSDILATYNLTIVLEVCIASAKLEELSLIDIDLSGVPSQLLGGAAGNLKKLSLWGPGSPAENLDTEQCSAVLEACIVSPTLVDLNLQWIDLEQVTIASLTQAAGHLHSLDLQGCSVNTEQLVALLETCITVPTLVGLDLGYMDLSGVPVDLFKRAAGHLSKMILDYSELTDEQENVVNNFDFTKIRVGEMEGGAIP